MKNYATFPAFKLILLALALLAPPAAFASSHDFQSYVGIDASHNRVRLVNKCRPCSQLDTGIRTFMGFKGGDDIPINLELFYIVSSHDHEYTRFIPDPLGGIAFTTRTVHHSTIYSNYGPMLKYRLEPFENLSVTPGLGLGFFKLENVFEKVTVKGIGLMFHIGAEYAFNDTFSIRAGYDYLDASADDVTGDNIYHDDVHHGTAGLVLSF